MYKYPIVLESFENYGSIRNGILKNLAKRFSFKTMLYELDIKLELELFSASMTKCAIRVFFALERRRSFRVEFKKDFNVSFPNDRDQS